MEQNPPEVNDVNFFDSQETANGIQTDSEKLTTEITETETRTQIFPDDKLCTSCLEKNLIEAGISDTFLSCPNCKELFCLHSASKIDPQCCVFCCNDFQVNVAEESYSRQSRNENGQVTSAKSYRVRHITLSGMHWLFYNRAIKNLSDIELDAAIEYHRGIRDGMLQERDARRAAHAHRNQGKRAGNEENSLLESTASSPIILTGEGAKVSLSSTNIKRTRTVKNTTSRAVKGITTNDCGIPDTVYNLFKAQGKSHDEIVAMVKGNG